MDPEAAAEELGGPAASPSSPAPAPAPAPAEARAGGGAWDRLPLASAPGGSPSSSARGRFISPRALATH